MPEVVTSSPDQSRYEVTRLEFRRRFELAELVALETAAEADPMLRVLKEDLSVAEFIRINDPRTVAGMDYLVTAGVLTETRKDEILTP